MTEVIVVILAGIHFTRYLNIHRHEEITGNTQSGAYLNSPVTLDWRVTRVFKYEPRCTFVPQYLLCTTRVHLVLCVRGILVAHVQFPVGIHGTLVNKNDSITKTDDYDSFFVNNNTLLIYIFFFLHVKQSPSSNLLIYLYVINIINLSQQRVLVCNCNSSITKK